MRITAALLFALAATGCTRENAGAFLDDGGTDGGDAGGEIDFGPCFPDCADTGLPSDLSTPLDFSTAIDLAGADLTTPPDLTPQPDLVAVCAPGVACTVAASGKMGLCPVPGACAACTDVADDANCNAVYGAPGSPYLCLSGGCVPGNCRTSADCSGGQVCLSNSCQPC